MSESNTICVVLRLRGETRMVSIPADSRVEDLLAAAQEVFKTPETFVALCWGRALSYTESVGDLSDVESVQLISYGK
jgi:hypothetical protein